MLFIVENGVLKKYKRKNSETEVVIFEGVTEIGEGAFKDFKLITSITIPDSVTEIGWNAFSGCISLTSINIPDSVTKIGWYAFESCISLTNINIPDSVKEIAGCAFENCKSLTSITIPYSITKINFEAFEGCTSLTNVIIPKNITEIEILNKFEKTPWFENLCENNTDFGIINNVLLRYKGSETDVIIPDGVKKIGWNAFSGYKNITSITIPESVTEIEELAFYSCINLTSITIPDSVTKIGLFAFECCTNLKSVTILNSITEIYKETFERCTSLEKIITPDFEIKIHGNNKIHKQVCFVVFKDFSIKISDEAKYSIIWQMFIQKPDDKNIFAYVKKNFTKMMKYAIDENNVEIITEVCKRKDLLTKRNIDKIIEHAIQHTQNGGTVEIQAILMRYKNDNIGYSEPDFSI